MSVMSATSPISATSATSAMDESAMDERAVVEVHCPCHLASGPESRFPWAAAGGTEVRVLVADDQQLHPWHRVEQRQ